MLYSAVLSLRVLPDDDRVDVGVERFVAWDALAWADVGVQVERLTEGEVEGDVAATDGCCKGTLQANLVLPNDL